MASNNQREILLSVRDMTVDFGNRRNPFRAVDHVSFDIYKGETFGLVGESGSGKTTIGRAIIRINPISGGEVLYEGERISGRISREKDREVTRKIQMIFQDPMASLNERAKVDYIVSEGLYNVHQGLTEGERRERVERALKAVGLLPEFASRFPHEFSGGQRQRIGIARAIALNPRLIICDEPVSALDVSIQSQVLNLLKDLQERYGLTYLFISHDLSVVKFIADRVCVMFLGSVCEIGDTDKLYEKPLHPYTHFLLSAIPKADPRLRNPDKELLSGEIPSPVNPPSGCRFHTRCPYAKDICSQKTPECKKVEGRQVFCHFPLD